MPFSVKEHNFSYTTYLCRYFSDFRIWVCTSWKVHYNPISQAQSFSTWQYKYSWWLIRKTILQNIWKKSNSMVSNGKTYLHGSLEKFLNRVLSICLLCAQLPWQPSAQYPLTQIMRNFRSISCTARQPLFLWYSMGEQTNWSICLKISISSSARLLPSSPLYIKFLLISTRKKK